MWLFDLFNSKVQAQKKEYYEMNHSQKYLNIFKSLNNFAETQLLVFRLADRDLSLLLSDEDKKQKMIFFFGGAADYATQTLNLNDGAYGAVTSIYSHPLTNSAPTVYVPTGGAAERGTALYSKNFATLWGSNSNVLTVLDVNVFQDSFLNWENNRQFADNVANWVANSGTVVPEPATLLLLGSGLLGLLGVGAKRKV